MRNSRMSRRHLLQVATVSAATPSGFETATKRLSTKGLFMHAWDLRDEGVDRVMGWMTDSGLNRAVIAGCYHSGWFIHPHSPARRAFMSEGSVAYFQPDEKLYERTPMRPHVSSIAKDTNWLAVMGERLDKYNLEMVSWTIGAHNTRLGLQYPQYTQINVYGDSIPHALSIGHDATREYLKAMCRDLAVNYPMRGLQLESFGWGTLAHRHHHERDFTGLTPLEQELLAMCFNPQTVEKAEAAGIDAKKAAKLVRATLDAAFREAPERPRGHPRSMGELEASSADLKAYNAFRKELEYSLVFEIKDQALKGTSCKLLLQDGYSPALARAADGFATGACGAAPEKVLEIVTAGRVAIPDNWRGEYPCFICLGMGVPSSQQQLRGIVLALKQGGSTGPIFYNYSEAPQKMLRWIKGALASQ